MDILWRENATTCSTRRAAYVASPATSWSAQAFVSAKSPASGREKKLHARVSSPQGLLICVICNLHHITRITSRALSHNFVQLIILNKLLKDH